jgi:hypothetical protein
MPKLLWTSSGTMSHELCAHIAHAEKWPVFGLQYGTEVRADSSTSSMQLLQPVQGCELVVVAAVQHGALLLHGDG